MAATRSSAPTGSLARLAALADYSWLNQLVPDPETQRHVPNKSSRQVRSGHYVCVEPTPLPEPHLVIHSSAMAAELGLSDSECHTELFARVFSGEVSALKLRSWATPYALSIYGQPMTNNCPFKNGNGYGDGRAISIAEVLLDDDGGGGGRRWELQLKGAGPTPFCRGADGRAVLRSSIREFLASEAMHALGVSTTRALSLVASGSASVQRPWYSSAEATDPSALAARNQPDEDDPRLARFPPEIRTMLLQQLRMESRDPDMMQTEQCAITCRAAPSFVRVGHLELHGRRCAASPTREHVAMLESMVEHALFREYASLSPAAVQAGAATEVEAGSVDHTQPLPKRALAMLRECGIRLATLTADWIRVGYVQGNFNSDNCLVGGRTMDYGPFGFIEQYEPLWNMWSGGGEHFGFLNQPIAGAKNLGSLATALMPLLDEAGRREAEQIAGRQPELARAALDAVWRSKLGLGGSGAAHAAAAFVAEAAGGGGLDAAAKQDTATARTLFGELEPLLRSTQGGVDYTIFWRELAAAAELLAADEDIDVVAGDADPSSPRARALALRLLRPLRAAFYAGDDAVSAGGDAERVWCAWMLRWSAALAAARGGRDNNTAAAATSAAADMRRASPKFIPREWMLVAAYRAARGGDYTRVAQLHELLAHPYDEGTREETTAFYRKRPAADNERGGTAFMS